MKFLRWIGDVVWTYGIPMFVVLMVLAPTSFDVLLTSITYVVNLAIITFVVLLGYIIWVCIRIVATSSSEPPVTPERRD